MTDNKPDIHLDKVTKQLYIDFKEVLEWLDTQEENESNMMLKFLCNQIVIDHIHDVIKKLDGLRCVLEDIEFDDVHPDKKIVAKVLVKKYTDELLKEFGENSIYWKHHDKDFKYYFDHVFGGTRDITDVFKILKEENSTTIEAYWKTVHPLQEDDILKEENSTTIEAYWKQVHPLQEDDGGGFVCSNCETGNFDIDGTEDTCPYCGAKMTKPEIYTDEITNITYVDFEDVLEWIEDKEENEYTEILKYLCNQIINDHIHDVIRKLISLEGALVIADDKDFNQIITPEEKLISEYQVKTYKDELSQEYYDGYIEPELSKYHDKDFEHYFNYVFKGTYNVTDVFEDFKRKE